MTTMLVDTLRQCRACDGYFDAGDGHACTPATAPAIEEGGSCPEPGCGGRLIINQEPCYCAATHAPCSACEGRWLECATCGWRDER